MQIGIQLDSKTITARWAFLEFRSQRWQQHYAAFQPNNIRQGVAFADLTPQEVDHLEYMARQYRAGLVGALDPFALWESQAWTKDQLGRTLTIPRMAPNRNSHIPFLSFIACPRFLNSKGPPEAGDPRTDADTVPLDAPFNQDEPVIVAPVNGAPMLIDGY